MDFSGVSYEQIVGALLSLHAVAVVIVNVTKTPVDNELLAKAYRYIEFFAGFVSYKAKQ